MTRSLVALSIDGVPSYSWLARRSIESLRRAGTKLPVVVFASGGADLDVSDLPDVELISVDGNQHESVYVEKWYRLARLEAERVIFLDADTICLQPMELLLDKYQVEDIYARQEAGTQRPQGANIDSGFRAQVDWEVFDGQWKPSARRLAVVNTGVMVLNHWSCHRITQSLDDLCEIYNEWTSNTIPYPCTNDHIMEELAFSAALGRAVSPTLGLLSPEHAPFYAELALGASFRGIVLHVWSGLYRKYLLKVAGRKDLAEYDFQRRRDRLARIQLASRPMQGKPLTRP